MEAKVTAVPKWLVGFLEPDYFTECNEHIHTNAKSRADQNSKKGDRNFYCVECCKGPLCDTGRQLEHSGHHVLQVRKASHTDAIRINDIVKLIDVSHIQTYTINGAKIVFLPSRPQAKPAKGAPRYCEVCHRSLADQVRFCSLSCKLKAIIANPTDASLALKAGTSGLYYGAGGEMEMTTTSDCGSDFLRPSSPSPVTPMKKRARSNKGHSLMQHQEDIRPVKNLKVHREHAPGLTGMNHHLMPPHSPTSVLHHEHSLLAETSGPVSPCLESMDSPDSPEVMSFRKRSRKGAPYRAPGVGIINEFQFFL